MMTQNTKNETDTTWDDVCRCAKAGFDWCVSNARRYRLAGELDPALKWLSVATWSATKSGFFGQLASNELEQEIIDCAILMGLDDSWKRSGGGSRWVHVLDQAHPMGGHSALCWRWIEARSGVEQHNVLLLDQQSPVPEQLRRAVELSDGTVHCLEPRSNLVQRARQLRSWTCAHGDVVVLHTHAASIISTVAFGQSGGPPVIVLNHADHLFQSTGVVADVVFDIRDSGAEWTRTCRGINRSIVVPIPLIEQPAGNGLYDRERRSAREQLGLPTDSVTLLTIGSEFKYERTRELSFHDAIARVILAHRRAALVAVGPEDEGEWRRLRKLTGGRIRAIGEQLNLEPFHRSADIYVEGFPFGSLTAMLEAGLAGLPCVRAPGDVPPPFASDGIAFRGVSQPTNVSDYTAQIEELINKPEIRKKCSSQLRADIRAHHCSEGWMRHLESGIKLVPTQHRLNLRRKLHAVPQRARDFWLGRIHFARERFRWEKVGAAILSEARLRGLNILRADYSELAGLMEGCLPNARNSNTAGKLESISAPTGIGAAQRLARCTRKNFRDRRLVNLWEASKQNVFRRLGVVSIVRRAGRAVLRDICR